jgi:hypothetical protein
MSCIAKVRQKFSRNGLDFLEFRCGYCVNEFRYFVFDPGCVMLYEVASEAVDGDKAGLGESVSSDGETSSCERGLLGRDTGRAI